MLRWLLLICLLPQVGCSRIVVQDVVYKEKHGHEKVAVTTRPRIHHCRSRSMEDFTCWWHPLENLTDGEQVAYVLTYRKDNGPKQECPDYRSAGPNSCHFDRGHTSMWMMYCMNVTAVTARRNYTSQEHCLDVADIAETRVNLTYLLPGAGGEETGRKARPGFSANFEWSEEVAVTTRPHIYHCRSRNMEDFTCWWHPLENLTDGEQAAYILTYSKDNGPRHQCPDYTTAGPNSCHFDSGHTSIWMMYCMNVTAVTARRNYTSRERCLDVADIVETEAPVNLTYTLVDAGGDEMGHNARLSWTYPEPSDLQYGWITLVYELQYRRVAEPDDWKVKHPLQEPHLLLLGLPVGDYVVRVRCRSHNYGRWSKWSSAMLMSVPARPAGKVLVRVLVPGVGVVALLVLAFGVIPQSKRIKDYLLPPIPKPRIIGVDPLLLKKGNFDKINSHLSNFHSYRPPSYAEEVWEQVSADHVYLTPRDCGAQLDTEKDALMGPRDLTPVAADYQFPAQNPTSYVQSLSLSCFSPPQAFAPSLDLPSPWSRPEVMTLPGTDYSVMGHPGLPKAVPAPAAGGGVMNRSQQDFYTCVQLMNESGEVHLVPCLPPAYCREFPPLPTDDINAAGEEKKKVADCQNKMNATNRLRDGGGGGGGGEAERSKAADPLLSSAADSQG